MNIPKICVVGSSNFDLIAYTSRMPKVGETILGHDFKMGCGGKGANQAVAAAKLGANVTMVTKLGDDIFGQQTLQNYQNQKINTQYIQITNQASSGVAPIWVDDTGSNSIIVVPGANHLMTAQEIENIADVIKKSNVIMCQNEIPFEVTQKTLEIAKQNNVTTIFNPAPAFTHPLSDDFWSLIDILCPNETETEILTGKSVNSIEDAKNAASILLNKGIQTLIITLGAKGSFLANKNKTVHFEAQKVKAIDTTGAGDCFLGSFGFFYGAGLSCEESIKRAQIVASVSVQHHGTQTSYPKRDQLPQALFDFDFV